ncbi:MAG: hypothetical protein ACI9CA_000440 [Natronomonas sp.]|jgi:hypothetical protein
MPGERSTDSTDADQPDTNPTGDAPFHVEYENGLGAEETAAFEGSRAVTVFCEAIEEAGGEVLAVETDPEAAADALGLGGSRVEEHAFAVVNENPHPDEQACPLTIVLNENTGPAIYDDREEAIAMRDKWAAEYDNPALTVYGLRGTPISRDEQDDPPLADAS